MRGACWFALGLITQRYVGSIPTPALKNENKNENEI